MTRSQRWCWFALAFLVMLPLAWSQDDPGSDVDASGASTGATIQIDLLTMQTLPNRNCIAFTLLGPCQCGTPPVPACVRFAYWEPTWLVETVKRADRTQIGGLQPFLIQALQTLGGIEGPGGGATATPSGGRTNLHFHEARVMQFPRLFPGPCDNCVGQLSSLVEVHYVSDIDPTWRRGQGIQNPLAFGLRLGFWGLLYPRVGFSITGSKPVSSGIAAYRAFDIAFNPTGIGPVPEVHPVLSPTGATTACMQLARPRQTGCFNAGAFPALWETATVSPVGEYLWILWRRRTCCVDPASATCGLVSIGGGGANQCLG